MEHFWGDHLTDGLCSLQGQETEQLEELPYTGKSFVCSDLPD